MCEGAREAIFYRSLFNEIGSGFLVRNPVTKKRSKRIDIKYHYLRDKYDSNEIEITYVASADLITKCFPKFKHTNCCKMLNMKL